MLAWRKIDEMPLGDGALPWLYAVAYRVISHQWRSVRRYRRLVARLGSVLKRLAGWEGLPHSDIARILGCSVEAVGQRLHRAKKRLAKELQAAGLISLQPPGSAQEGGSP
jgi:RNA polymerase sigma-70 factor (ECF subfamily)